MRWYAIDRLVKGSSVRDLTWGKQALRKLSKEGRIWAKFEKQVGIRERKGRLGNPARVVEERDEKAQEKWTVKDCTPQLVNKPGCHWARGQRGTRGGGRKGSRARGAWVPRVEGSEAGVQFWEGDSGEEALVQEILCGSSRKSFALSWVLNHLFAKSGSQEPLCRLSSNSCVGQFWFPMF